MSTGPNINPNAVKSEIRVALINNKVNACPMAIRVAWHSSGTYNKHTGKGGSNGGTMRFAYEANDKANAGLSIIRDMLHPVQVSNPSISSADLWTAAGASAVEFCGGPEIPHKYGRTDAPDASHCPPNGLIPDAAQGADHLREMFYRMGMNDQEIVALSGAHTLGRCHLTRSGYDGPWTSTPLSFNNEYFRNLMNLEWREKNWDGPQMYEDVATQRLIMLPTDMALRTDPVFRVYARRYADDQDAFFKDFAAAYAKLLELGVPRGAAAAPAAAKLTPEKERLNAELREYAMHGSIEKVTQFRNAGGCPHSVEGYSGRTALHKAAFWGHIHVIKYLIEECHVDLNAVDFNGDTAIHDAARFAHESVVDELIKAGADLTIRNKDGRTPLQVATEYSTTSTANKHDVVIRLLQEAERNSNNSRPQTVFNRSGAAGGGCPFKHNHSKL